MNDGNALLPYWPAALNQKMAAAYCGLSVDTFKKVCPVKPIKFTSSAWGERFLRQRLDEWLLSLDPNSPPPQLKFEDYFTGGSNDGAVTKRRKKRTWS